MKSHGLLSSVNVSHGYIETLVRAFYSNLKYVVVDSLSEFYHKVYVRGKVVDFSPMVIHFVIKFNSSATTDNNMLVEDSELDIVIDSLIGGNHHQWPNDGKIPTSQLCMP